MGFFKNLFQKKTNLQYKKALEKGSLHLGDVKALMESHKTLNQEVLEAVEISLLSSDCGMQTTDAIIDYVLKTHKQEPIITFEQLLDVIASWMDSHVLEGILDLSKPKILMIVGVNGVGKTTTIGKLAHRYQLQKPLIIAGDTFRAAAVDQLEVWANKNHVAFFKSEQKDPSAVIYEGIQQGIHDNHQLIIIDTAGRLQAKENLMQELAKMYRVIQKFESHYSIETLLVLDATTGQNGLSQAKAFKEIANISGIIMTKLDGTAKGGIMLSIAKETSLPVYMVGLGEGLEDLKPFDKTSYIISLLNQESLWN